MCDLSLWGGGKTRWTHGNPLARPLTLPSAPWRRPVPGHGWEEEATRHLRRVRETMPLTHHLTNLVVMHWTANVTLALGESPIMTPEPEEFPNITLGQARW